MKQIILIALLATFSLHVYAQNDFRTRQSGNWNDSNTWEEFTGGSWQNTANIPSFSDGQITISSGHNVTIPNGYTASVDQLVLVSNANTFVTVASGGILDVRDGSGDDVTLGTQSNRGRIIVQGDFVINEGATIVNASDLRLIIQSGGRYIHNYETTPGTIYPATWENGSILEFTGYKQLNIAPANFIGGNFKNVVWNCDDQEDDITLNLSGSTTIQESFIVKSTNPFDQFYLMLGENNDFTLNINGDLIIEDDAILYVAGYTSTGISAEINVGGDFLFSNSNANYISMLAAAAGDDVTVNVSGRLVVDAPGNRLGFCENAGAAARIVVSGNVEIINGVLFTTANSNSNLIFAGSNQSFINNNVPTTSQINFVVANNARLTLPQGSYLSGTGTFSLGTTSPATLVLQSVHPTGSIQAFSSTSSGNIRVSGARTFTAGSRIVYNGAAAQVIGTGFPTGGDVNLEIDNAAGVSMNGNLTFNTGRQLILTSGALTVGDNTLTVNGNLSGSGALSTTDGSSLSFGGSGSAITLRFTGTEGEVGNFTLDRNTDAPVVLADSMRIYGTFTNTKGVLDISGQSLQISGAYSAGAGSLKTNASSSLRVNTGGTATTFTGNLNFTSGSLLGLLRINRLGATIPTNSNVTASRLELISGTLGNTSSLEIASGGRILRDAGSMNTIPGGSNPYSVEYIAGTGISTDNELPNASDSLRLQTLCVRSGNITLGKSIVINDSAVFKGGQFNADDKIVFMFGPNWTYAGGTFVSNTSVNFARTTTIGGTGTIQFTNLQINSTGNLTLPSTMSVTGTYQAFAGSTVNPNNGTVLFNGGGSQQIFGGNTGLHNITVDKNGGDVSIANPLQMFGALTILSNTAFDAGNGRLTLRSTDDDPATDARIAELPSGATFSGNVTVQRFMSGEGRIYRYLSVPVSGATVASWQDNFPISGTFAGANPTQLNNPSLFHYIEPLPGELDDSWEPYPDPVTGRSTDPLLVGRGYAAYIRLAASPTVVDVTGPINKGDISLPISFTNNGSDADGWNLVGNPYPSAVDWQLASGWTKTPNLNEAIYVRDNGNGGVYASFVNGLGANGGNGRIALGQAFWVKAASAGAALTIKEAAKTGLANTFFREDEPENVLRFYVKNDTIQDEGVIYFQSEATDQFDGDFDALKLPNESFNVFSWSDDNKKIAINGFKQEKYIQKEVKIGLSNIKNGTYNFNIANLRSFIGPFNFILTDLYTNSVLEFTNDKDSIGFQFSVTDEDLSRSEDRFRLMITQIITGLDDENEDLIRLFPNPGSKFVFLAPGQEQLREGYLIDNRGAVVKKLEFGMRDENGTFSLDIGDLKNGIYLLRLHTDSGSVVIKKLLVQ